MPISPAEAKRKAQQKRTPEYKAVLKRIDEMLVEGDRTFAASLLDGVSLDDIAEAYGPVGWHVTFRIDWRDGDYLEFTERAGYAGTVARECPTCDSNGCPAAFGRGGCYNVPA